MCETTIRTADGGTMTIPPWLHLFLIAAKPHIPKDFVGQIEVNVFKGGVSNVLVKQSYKEENTK